MGSKFLLAVALIVSAPAFTPQTTCAPCAFERDANGPVATFENGARPTYTEYSRSGYDAKVAIGALGGVEANVSYNMNYADNVHRLYDTSKNAYWSAWNTYGYTLQFAPSGCTSGDCWTQYGIAPFHVGVDGAQFVSNNSGVPYQTWSYNATNALGGATVWQLSGADRGYVGVARALSSSYSTDDFAVWAVSDLKLHGYSVSLEGNVSVNGHNIEQTISRLEARIQELEARLARRVQ